MKPFLDDNFLLNNSAAERLYHDYAKLQPVIDYHCHLPPDEILENKQYGNITKIWLDGDHYKWRAMRSYGVNERYCTGEASDEEKFMKWAETVPFTIRNPLYHWTHMELKNPFGIDQLLTPDTASDIYIHCNDKLASPAFSTRSLLKHFNVELLCTSDDPVDDLTSHKKLNTEGFEIKVLPTFRADNSIQFDDPVAFNQYLDDLTKASNISISSFDDYQQALAQRHQYFHDNGCRLYDHGLEIFYAEDFKESELQQIFSSLRKCRKVAHQDGKKLKTALLLFLAELNHNKGWVQQYHVGAIRNNNSRMLNCLGPNTGFDSMGDGTYAKSLSKFLDLLDAKNQLTKTILYNLNPRDNEMLATMVGNFNDGSVAGKVQFGPAWWFLDQKDGMTKQMDALSNMGLLSKFVGMVTDSRSFLSYSRHEYFRRLLCNLMGTDIENGELPSDYDWIGKIVNDICYNNPKNYFGFE